jgi:uncharacterized protein YndB with AHSA1/START domain
MASANPRPIGKATMIIRRPASEIYRAFVEPEMLTRFWLSAASGPLIVGQPVRWDFMVPGATLQCEARVLDEAKTIEVGWPDGMTVTWRFSAGIESSTLVEVEHQGFKGSPQEQLDAAIDSTQGFSIVLCDVKVLLETNVSPHLVRDKALHLTAARDAAN